MSYELHVTRADDWGQSDSAPIALSEWLLTVKHDPELRPTPTWERLLPNGQVLRVDLGEGGALWFGDPGVPEGIPLWWTEGRITCTCRVPDRLFLEKFKVLARRLGARVQGDQREGY